MKVNPKQFYSLLEVQKITGIKSRRYLAQYIDEGFLLAIKTGTGVKLRYAILGEWVTDFMKRYKKGLIKGGQGNKGRRYSKEEATKILQDAISKLQ